MLDLTTDQINSLYPVIGARLYRGGIAVLRLNLSPWEGSKQKPERGKVTRLTRKSLINLAFLATTNASTFRTLITLTYGVNFPTKGATVKKHLNRVLTRLRQVYGDLDYLWFLEFQGRGAPHVHVLASLRPPDDGERHWLADLWARISNDGHNWPYSSVRFYRGKIRRHHSLTTMGAVRYEHCKPEVWEEIRAKNGAARYVIKYATKPRQKKIPLNYQDVGRWWGASRSVTLGDYEVVTGSEGQIREYLTLRGRDMGGYDLLPKYIMVNGSQT
jgi:hypothetical protein